MAEAAHEGRSHELISTRLVLQTVLVYVALCTAAVLLGRGASSLSGVALLLVWLAQGLWLDRMYTVAHEGVHRKLFPAQPWLNEAIATILLLPICAPLTIFRKIHFLHHSQNRRDPATAALDSFVLRKAPSWIGRIYYRAAWIFCVFCGGFFLHTLISFVLFLFVPTKTAVRISPVFRGWSVAQRVRAFFELACAAALHVALYRLLGARGWATGFGLPLLPFAWIFSLLLYIYHYRTSMGKDVRHNVRSLPQHRVFSWLLLNFNQHATHHHDPSLPWYRLPLEPHKLPQELAENDNVSSLWQAVAQLRHGPLLWRRAAPGDTFKQVEP